MKRIANRECDFVWQHYDIAGRGDGVNFPIANYGGLVTFVYDVDVPAITHGTSANWVLTYPDLGGGPVTDLPILRYAQPLDTSLKLHGKGNFLVTNAEILYGVAVVGSQQPDTSPAGGVMTASVAVYTLSPSQVVYTLTGTWPTGSGTKGIVTATTRGKALLGTDYGQIDLMLSFANTHGSNNLVAGRIRVVLTGHEV